jgi:hypothetical protein
VEQGEGGPSRHMSEGMPLPMANFLAARSCNLLYYKDLAILWINKYKNIDFCGTLFGVLVLYVVKCPNTFFWLHSVSKTRNCFVENGYFATQFSPRKDSRKRAKNSDCFLSGEIYEF